MRTLKQIAFGGKFNAGVDPATLSRWGYTKYILVSMADGMLFVLAITGVQLALVYLVFSPLLQQFDHTTTIGKVAFPLMFVLIVGLGFLQVNRLASFMNWLVESGQARRLAGR